VSRVSKAQRFLMQSQSECPYRRRGGRGTRRACEQILSGKIACHENASAAVQIKEYVGSVVLVFASEAQAMLAEGPIEGVAQLVAG